MKKANTNTTVTTTEAKPKRIRAKRKFFLYVEGKGIISATDIGMPTFNDGDVLVFDTKGKAVFARDFFVSVKFADSIDILTKVA